MPRPASHDGAWLQRCASFQASHSFESAPRILHRTLSRSLSLSFDTHRLKRRCALGVRAAPVMG